MDGVHDARDGSVDRHVRGQEGITGFPAARPVDQFARARARPVGAHQPLARRFEFRRQRLHQQQALALCRQIGNPAAEADVPDADDVDDVDDDTAVDDPAAEPAE